MTSVGLRYAGWGALLLTPLLALAAPTGVAGQERPDTLPPDSAAADTLLTARDSARARVRQRLEALARPPGTAPDTLPDPGAAGARASGSASAAGLPPTDSVMTALMALEGYRTTRYSSVAARYDARQEQLVLYGGAGVPGAPEEPDTLTTEEADSVLAAADSLRARVDSLGSLLTDTAAVPEAGREALVARMDSLQALADSLTRRARPGEEGPEVRRATLAGAEGYRLEGEEYILYDQRRETAQARGDPTFTPAEGGGDPVEADSLNIDVSGERASAFEARTRYAQGGGTDWNVRGDLPYVGQRLVYGSHTRFTSCDLENPHYHFETDNLKIVQGQVMVARPVRLYFADVPVAWLPFVAQSLAQGRASGLLTPRFSVNDIVRTSGGYRRRLSNVGFYWAMSDYTDATVAMDWFDDTYTALTGSLRFRWLRQFLNGSFNFRQYWRESGSTQQSLDSQASWEPSERTSFRSSIRYASSTDFVRRHSLDPREVTQQITSSGGLSHRFDWGSMNVTGNRTQSLSDDQVVMTLPDVSLSMNTLTLFPAPSARARWYNNLSWSGGTSFSRQITDRAPADTVPFSFGTADTETRNASVRTSFSLGNLSLSQSVTYREGATRAVPVDSLGFFPGRVAQQGMSAFNSRLGRAWLDDLTARQEGGGTERVDISDARLGWNTSLGYQQTLIGSTTLTPSLTLSGESMRVDTVQAAQSLVAGPTRLSLGLDLKADVYGFYGGFGPYEAIRHKITPSIRYDYAPEVQPSALQREVFGSRVVHPRSVVTLGFNQTWEAKREADQTDTATVVGNEPEPREAVDEPVGIDDTPPEVATSDAGTPGDLSAPRRQEQSQIVNLLSIRTSSTTYDFVADSLGYLFGFQQTTLDNQISSDFLPGLTIAMSHDLFDDRQEEVGEGEEPIPTREFDLHLRSLNFGFSLSPRSGIFGLLGLGGDDGAVGDASQADEEDLTADDPFATRSATDESTILPGQGTDQDVRESRSAGDGRAGDWNASFRYSLTRPRAGGSQVSQILGIRVNLNPTSQWEMSWDTAYDLETHSFNDHSVRLTRDLHRWQAHFDFRKTTTGNWQFRFEVSLLDNQDLHFDYEQRNVDLETPGG